MMMSLPTKNEDLRVCIFESRKSTEMANLLVRAGLPRVTVAPSMREIPLSENSHALSFANDLIAGRIDLMIFLTGVGARALDEVIVSRYSHEQFCDALGKCTVVVRGPKPAAVLREWKFRIDAQVPEPNTWRDLLALLDARFPVAGKRVAVQEYGAPSDELYAGLTERGATVTPVPVYRWALPEEIGPLQQSIAATLKGEIDVLIFTSAQQLRHVLEVAEQTGERDAWIAAARKCIIASIGPTASETLREAGLEVDIEPEHPKMGHLALAVARDLLAVLVAKRESRS